MAGCLRAAGHRGRPYPAECGPRRGRYDDEGEEDGAEGPGLPRAPAIVRRPANTRTLRDLRAGARGGRAAADAQRLPAAGGGGGRADAGRPPGLRPADRRRARDRQRGHPVRRRRRYRLPDEDVGARAFGRRSGDEAARTDLGARGRDPLRRRRHVSRPAPARGDGRGLERVERHGRPEGSRLGAARHERQRQPLRRVRRPHGARRVARPRSRGVPRAAQPLRKPRHRERGGDALQPRGARPASRTAARAGSPRLARPGHGRGAGVPGRRWS